jgi:ATP synthase protein I
MSERFDRGGWGDEEAEEAPVPLTRSQAQALRDEQPQVSVWAVVAAQGVAGVALAVLAWGVTGRGAAGWSALYGAAVVALPGAMLARGVGRLRGAGPTAGAIGFLVWQGVKMVLSLALLLGASKVVPDLNWPALLVALAVCLQVNWLALLWRGRAKKNERR